MPGNMGPATTAIDIRPSPRARSFVILVWLAGLWLLWAQQLQWVWLAQSIWTLTLFLSARNTHGLGREHLRLAEGPEGWGIVHGGEHWPLTGARAGIVTVGLTTGVLYAAGRAFPVIAMPDNLSGRQHWRLRRLLLQEG